MLQLAGLAGQALQSVGHLSDSDEMEYRPARPPGRRPPQEQAGQPGHAGPVPMSLGRAQLDGQEITYPAQYVRVEAWVPFTDGTHQSVRAMAVAWTKQAVKVVWRVGGEEPTEFQAWVWGQAVTRSRLSGPHPTDDPATNVYRQRHPEGDREPAPDSRPSVRPPRTRPW